MLSRTATAVLCALLLSTAAVADESPPSDDSIADMLQLTHAEDNFASLKPQVEAMMRKEMDDAMGNNALAPAQLAVWQRGRERMVAAVSTRYTWEAMRQIYLRVYQAAFTQDELNQIIAFYRTPAGQALINKMPLLQQQLLHETQEWMRPLLNDIKTIAQETRAEMEKASSDGK